MVKCVICKREFNRSGKFIEFFEFYNKNKVFMICRADLKMIVDKIKEMVIEPESYREHINWNLREKNLSEVARKIYKECKNKHKKIDIKKIGDKIYDLMCEDCWNQFRKEESHVKE